MDQGPSINIHILKNESFQIRIRDTNLVNLAKIPAENVEGIPLMEAFQGRGKYQHTKFGYEPATSTFLVQVTRKKMKVRDRKSVVEYAETIWKIWDFNMRRIKDLLERPWKYGKCTLESLDALGFDFSITAIESGDRKYYFRFSDMEFNGNLAMYDFTKTLYPTIIYLPTKGDYYRSPRLPFLEEINNNFKFPEIFNWLEKNFTIGLTLYGNHFYPRLLEEDTNKEKFGQGMEVEEDESRRELVKEIETKRKEFNRKVFNLSILTTVGRTMNYFTVTLESEYNKTSDKPEHYFKLHKSNTDTQVRLQFSEETANRIFQSKHSWNPYFKDVKYDENRRETYFSYKDRLVFEYIILCFEIFCQKCTERNISKLRQTNKADHIKPQQALISSISLESFEVIVSPSFYMRVKVNKNEAYEVDFIKTDFTWEKYKAIQMENTKNPDAIKTKTSDSERTQEEHHSLFEEYPHLKDYINWYINTFNIREVMKEVADLCEACSKPDTNYAMKELINKIIKGASQYVQYWDSIVKVKIERNSSVMNAPVPNHYYLTITIRVLQHYKVTKLSLASPEDQDLKVEMTTDVSYFSDTKKVSDILANFNFDRFV